MARSPDLDRRQQLLEALIEEFAAGGIGEGVERRQMGRLTDLPTDPAEAFAAMWADLHRPELRNVERLFFECYARAAQGEKPFNRMIPGAVSGWLAEVEAVADGAFDPAMARLGLAITRGLLLDLVATNDDAGVDAAANAFIQLMSRWL